MIIKGIKTVILGLVVFVFLGQSAGEVNGQPITPLPAISLSFKHGGLTSPVHVTNARDGSNRLFIVEQPGRIRIVKNGVLLATPFLDISNTGANRVLFNGEQGLLSVAFPLQFNTKGYFYVYYTNLNGNNVAARYFLTTDPDVADPNSEVILQTFLHPVFANHNGGQLAFGPDGFLYIGTGDGGSGGDPNNNAQSPGSFLGKILRIDVESVINPRIDTYVIPPSNPFFTTQGFLPEIWALGLRNPFRFSFDRFTGDLYIGDVGQNLFEEIDFQPASSPGGENYGWNIMEGFHCFNPLDFFNPLPTCNQTGLAMPVIEYNHTQLDCAVTGGFVYRGSLHPQMQGTYFYGDFCTGRIWGLQFSGGVWQSTLALDSPLLISSFGEDEAGELYVADYGTGNIYGITVRASMDFNGDAKTDILWRHTSGTVAEWVMNGTSISSVNVPGSVNSNWEIKGVGDFDGDGKADILWQETVSGTVAIWFMNGAAVTSVGIPGTISIDWQIKAVGDFNADGNADILWQHTSGLVVIWLMNGSTVTSVGVQGMVSSDWQIKGVGDFNADGNADILWQHTSGDLAVWLMNGLTVASIGAPGAISTNWQIKGIGDFDGDRMADILWQETASRTVAIWFMNGAVVSSVGVPGTISTNWQIKNTGDFNGDGKADILWQETTSGTVAVWLMNGASTASVGIVGTASSDWQIMKP
jgi:glucose/arabinose dehydrogenase